MSRATTLLTLAVLVLCAAPAQAGKTPAGTVIDNTATLSYSIGTSPPETAKSNTASFQVAEIVGAQIGCADAAKVAVDSPATARVLSFQLTNPGNGSETYTLTRNNALAGSDSFDPVSSGTPGIYLESNGTPGLQTGAGGDTAYASDLTLAAEKSQTLYVLSDIPAALAIGSTGDVALTAASATTGAAGAAPGTPLPGLGDGGIMAMVGPTQAQATATCGYIVSGLAVNLDKTASVVGGGDAAPGKTLAYTLTVKIDGSGTASKLVIKDPLPPELTYQANSIAVNGAPRSDAADADNAQFSGNVVTVDFGDVVAPATQVITFNATVN